MRRLTVQTYLLFLWLGPDAFSRGRFPLFSSICNLEVYAYERAVFTDSTGVKTKREPSSAQLTGAARTDRPLERSNDDVVDSVVFIVDCERRGRRCVFFVGFLKRSRLGGSVSGRWRRRRSAGDGGFVRVVNIGAVLRGSRRGDGSWQRDRRWLGGCVAFRCCWIRFRGSLGWLPRPERQARRHEIRETADEQKKTTTADRLPVLVRTVCRFTARSFSFVGR